MFTPDGSAEGRQQLARIPRTEISLRRDERAGRRDAAAGSRDSAAEARDRAAGRHEQVPPAADDSGQVTPRALRAAVGASRGYAAADRAYAARDRQHAATDRAQAAGDREQAAADREQAAIDLQHAQHDSLTGVYMRDLGRVTLQHEIDRCRRSGEPYLLAFIDVDGLKALNDREGHAAGDALLQAIVGAVKANVRSYDPIVRVGGDEFVCGLTNTELPPFERRVEEIRAAVEQPAVAGSITVGLASLGASDTLDDLTARADLDMYAHKPPVATLAARTAPRTPSD